MRRLALHRRVNSFQYVPLQLFPHIPLRLWALTTHQIMAFGWCQDLQRLIEPHTLFQINIYIIQLVIINQLDRITSNQNIFANVTIQMCQTRFTYLLLYRTLTSLLLLCSASASASKMLTQRYHNIWVQSSFTAIIPCTRLKLCKVSSSCTLKEAGPGHSV